MIIEMAERSQQRKNVYVTIRRAGTKESHSFLLPADTPVEKWTLKKLKRWLTQTCNFPGNSQHWFTFDNQKSLHGLTKNNEAPQSNVTGLYVYLTKMDRNPQGNQASEDEMFDSRLQQRNSTLPADVRQRMRPEPSVTQMIYPMYQQVLPQQVPVQQAPAQPQRVPAHHSAQQTFSAQQPPPVHQPAAAMPSTSNALPELKFFSDTCVICSEDAKVRCYDCDEQKSILCQICSDFAIHGEESTHRVVPYQKKPAGAIGAAVQPQQLQPVSNRSLTAPIPAVVAPKWVCEFCAAENLPLLPSCSLCMTDKPGDYEVPAGYQPTQEERAFIQRQEQADIDFDAGLRRVEQEEALAREQAYGTYIQMDDIGFVPNSEPFECKICYCDIDEGDGVVLRNCGHTFCIDCVKGQIEACEGAEVKCPYTDDDYQCNEVLEQREIRNIAPDLHERVLARGLQQAEAQAENSFHCKTTNCEGWCIYDDEANFFDCIICGKKNCLTCKAIHEGKNCKDYQDEIQRKAANDVEARQSKEAFDRMIANGEAMKCPKCGVIIMKKTGCDWLQCTMCKEEICWVMKMARWGPDGRGDYSGGCKCRLNMQPCHPNCGNCH